MVIDCLDPVSDLGAHGEGGDVVIEENRLGCYLGHQVRAISVDNVLYDRPAAIVQYWVPFYSEHASRRYGSEARIERRRGRLSDRYLPHRPVALASDVDCRHLQAVATTASNRVRYNEAERGRLVA